MFWTNEISVCVQHYRNNKISCFSQSWLPRTKRSTGKPVLLFIALSKCFFLFQNNILNVSVFTSMHKCNSFYFHHRSLPLQSCRSECGCVAAVSRSCPAVAWATSSGNAILMTSRRATHSPTSSKLAIMYLIIICFSLECVNEWLLCSLCVLQEHAESC